jgi:hypothetical protein
MARQPSEGEGQASTHSHPATTHGHDDYHVSQHPRGGPLVEFEHRASWHTHAHNREALPHSHDYDRAGEERDHAAPTASPA